MPPVVKEAVAPRVPSATVAPAAPGAPAASVAPTAPAASVAPVASVSTVAPVAPGAPDLPTGPAEASAAELPTPRALRNALGRFATGVTIITCVDAAGERVGLTANSFAALSLEPPLVLWSLRRASPSLAAFEAASHFAVNVLAETQVELSRRFAAPATAGAAIGERFGEGVWSTGLGGAPVLAGCAAVFECERAAVHDGGDHRLFVGRVLRLADLANAPLLFQGGRYHMLGEVL
jgi:flavin reductase (DIM6/NTAB) family NADH-FMN oxidoreductase RutF